jgi:hypothetical protein
MTQPLQDKFLDSVELIAGKLARRARACELIVAAEPTRKEELEKLRPTDRVGLESEMMFLRLHAMTLGIDSQRFAMALKRAVLGISSEGQFSCASARRYVGGIDPLLKPSISTEPERTQEGANPSRAGGKRSELHRRPRSTTRCVADQNACADLFLALGDK